MSNLASIRFNIFAFARCTALALLAAAFWTSIFQPAAALAPNFIHLNEEHFWETSNEQSLLQFFDDHELKVARPFWRKLQTINQDIDYYKTDHVYELSLPYDLEGMIFELSKVRDSDSFKISITTPEGDNLVYHNSRQIVLSPVRKGTYKMKLASNVFDHIGLSIFEADFVYPADGVMLLRDEDSQFPNYSEKVKAFLSRGGAVINLGSAKIQDWFSATQPQLSELTVSGTEDSIKYLKGIYYYIPQQLFLNEENATRVLNVLGSELNVAQAKAWTHDFAVLIFALLILGLAFKQRATIWQWINTNLFRLLGKLARAGIVVAALIIVVGPLLLYWYRNYSGLDLLKGVSIDDLIEAFNLKLFARVILAFIALIVVLYSLLIALHREATLPLSVRIKNRIGMLFQSQQELRRKNKSFVLGTSAILILLIFVLWAGFNAQSTEEPRVPISASGSIYVQQKALNLRTDIPLLYENYDGLLSELEDTFPRLESIKTFLATKLVGHDSVKYFYATPLKMLFYTKFEEDFTKGGKLFSGDIIVRNRNEDFNNKSFYLILKSLDGGKQQTLFFEGSNQVLGSNGRTASYHFEFPLDQPGIYELQIENANPLKNGDYELVGIAGNSEIFSINEVASNGGSTSKGWQEIQPPFEEQFQGIIRPFQEEKIAEKEYTLY